MLRATLRTLLVCGGLFASGCVDNSARRTPTPPDRSAHVMQLYRKYRTEAFEGTADVSVAEVEQRAGSQPVLFVDCREPEEREVSVIPESVSQAEFEARREEFRDHLVVPYCTIGYRSGVYTRDLTKDGFEAVNLIGGVLSWAHEGRTFVTPNGATTRNVHVYGPTWNLLPEGYQPFWDGAPRP